MAGKRVMKGSWRPMIGDKSIRAPTIRSVMPTASRYDLMRFC
jgi:hypothetical protein